MKNSIIFIIPIMFITLSFFVPLEDLHSIEVPAAIDQAFINTLYAKTLGSVFGVYEPNRVALNHLESFLGFEIASNALFYGRSPFKLDESKAIGSLSLGHFSFSDVIRDSGPGGRDLLLFSTMLSQTFAMEEAGKIGGFRQAIMTYLNLINICIEIFNKAFAYKTAFEPDVELLGQELKIFFIQINGFVTQGSFSLEERQAWGEFNASKRKGEKMFPTDIPGIDWASVDLRHKDPKEMLSKTPYNQFDELATPYPGSVELTDEFSLEKINTILGGILRKYVSRSAKNETTVFERTAVLLVNDILLELNTILLTSVKKILAADTHNAVLKEKKSKALNHLKIALSSLLEMQARLFLLSEDQFKIYSDDPAQYLRKISIAISPGNDTGKSTSSGF